MESLGCPGFVGPDRAASSVVDLDVDDSRTAARQLACHGS
jgi:hypothetical protein